MVEKVISLICEELGYDEDAVNENTEINELLADGHDIEEIAHIIEGEFYADIADELSGDMTLSQIAEMLE
ncbi:MAG: hypothetical protein E7547_07430 [Ruminococcaceae bacterium]|nr:hypothetical protein [Oscillospiraceae bacterium]